MAGERIEAKQGPTSWDHKVRVDHVAGGCKLAGKRWEREARQFGELIVLPVFICSVCKQTMKVTVT